MRSNFSLTKCLFTYAWIDSKQTFHDLDKFSSLRKVGNVLLKKEKKSIASNI